MKRFEKLGIKQTIQMHWMDRVLHLMLAGLSESAIRQDLNVYLATQKQSGGQGERGIKTYKMATSILSSWFSPSSELSIFRDEALSLAQRFPEDTWLPLHWAVISASYPFWFSVAKQVGRLLNLQAQITQDQVFNRMKELYGDRETVSRNSRYTIRSFIAWMVLRDTMPVGCYERGLQISIQEPDVAVLLLKTALYAEPGGKGTLSYLIKHPALFPFQLPRLSSDYIIRNTAQLHLVHHGLDDDLIILDQRSSNQNSH